MSISSSSSTPLSTSPIDDNASISTAASSLHSHHGRTHPIYSIASLSLGTCAHHDLPTKIRAASRLGYDAIEIFIPDFDAFVHEVGVGHHADLITEEEWLSVNDVKDLELVCAQALGRYTHEYGLSISCFQPFREYENFSGAHQSSVNETPLPARLKVALDRAENFIRLMPAMSCDLLLVCSNFLPVDPMTSTTWERYRDDQVVAFKELGALAQRYQVKIGYEPLAWGTAVNRWEQVWQVVERVDMPNVGVILDSFNSLGQQWADPSEPDFKRPIPHSALTENLALLSRTIPADKLFFYQVADAGRPAEPVKSVPTAPARMTWSRATRLFPMEQDGYLPVQEFTEAVMKTGYGGTWSLEVFNSSLNSSAHDVVQSHGKRGIDGLQKLYQACTSGKAKI